MNATATLEAPAALDEPAGLEIVTLTEDERTRCEVWTRVMGYHRPVASFNTGKQGEHQERRFYVERCCSERA
jgi:hypothetical protein